MGVLLLSALQIMLHRASAQRDHIVAITLAGRDRADLENVVAPIFRVAPIRSQVDDDTRIVDVLETAGKSLLEAHDHPHVPVAVPELEEVESRPGRFDPAVRVLYSFLYGATSERRTETTRHPSGRSKDADIGRLAGAPTNSGSFVLGNTSESYDIDGLFINTIDIPDRIVPYDLFLAASETDVGLELRLNYCVDLFEPYSAQRMLDHLLSVLDAAAEDASQTIWNLDAQSRPEPRRLNSYDG